MFYFTQILQGNVYLNLMLSNAGVNKVLLLGVTQQLFEEKLIGDQSFLCFELITAEPIKKGTIFVDHHEIHSIMVPQKLIEQDSLNLISGQTLYIEGKIQTTASYDSKKVKRYKLAIIASRVEILVSIIVPVVH